MQIATDCADYVGVIFNLCNPRNPLLLFSSLPQRVNIKELSLFRPTARPTRASWVS
jgi:hypothetical protein